MRLNALTLTNFRQHADTRLTFDLGLTGIIGPNGAGKTTILEAIAWALYGNPAARGTRETIRHVRAAARAPVRVELDFELAGHRYRVERGLTSAELYLDGSDAPIANTISGVSELLTRRLGMTRPEFFNTYFTGQKELNVMAAMGAQERAQFLSRVLGYDRLRIAQNLVREQKKLVVEKIGLMKGVMPDADAVARMLDESRIRLVAADETHLGAQRRHLDAESAVGVVTPRWSAAQRARDEMQALLSELRVAAGDLVARERDAERIAMELAAVDVARAELEALALQLTPLAGLAAEFRRFEELAREEGRRQALEEQARGLVDELSRLRERKDERQRAPEAEEEVVKKLEHKRRELEEISGTLEARRTDWVRDRQAAETRRDELRKQYTELKEQRDNVLNLGEDGACPTCTRPLGASFRALLDRLEEGMETIEVDGKWFNDRIEQLTEMPGEVKVLDERRREVQQDVETSTRQLAKVQAAVQELTALTRDLAQKEQQRERIAAELAGIPTGYDAARHAELRMETDRYAPLNDRATRLSAQIEHEDVLRVASAQSMRELAARRAAVQVLEEQRGATEFSEEDYEPLREEYEQASAMARAAEVALATARAEAGSARAAMEHAEQSRRDLERARETYDRLQRERRLHEELDRTWTDLRTDLNHELRPEISDLASVFLAELTDGRYSQLELNDQYDVIVLEDEIPKPVISGGEEDLSNLVLRLAISQMIAERAGQAFSLLVLDEVFGSLDETRRHNVIELLRRLQDRFEQVILITHIESVREGMDRVITVDFDETTGASRARQVDPGMPLLISGDGELQPAGMDEP